MLINANPSEECDLIMKGGLTSGIVYPRAVVELAKKYRFRQIGGASAGAIAATMAAAAELGRQRAIDGGTDTDAPFARLNTVPTELGSTLASLFQPSPTTAAAFDTLMIWVDTKRTMPSKLKSTAALIARRLPRVFWGTLAALAVAAALFDIALIGIPRSTHRMVLLIIALAIWVPVAMLVSLLVGAARLASQANEAIAANGFGMCNGHHRRTSTSPIALTDWMEETLRRLAGSADESPVCFGDLWGAAATRAYREAFIEVHGHGVPLVTHSHGEERLSPTIRRTLRGQRITDCLVMTTNLSHRRPYRFPFDTAEFMWCELCLRDYFPATVVDHMKARTVAVGTINVGTSEAPRSLAGTCTVHANAPLYYLPLAPDVPLVVAARISLSFPGLISALPFYSVDRTRTAEHQNVVQVWFSDGGIASNFPMRFFDAVWPSRPTFGINLSTINPDTSDMVWRPKPGSGGRLPKYTPLASLGSFVGSILDTMQNWNDNIQITMPGFRDRIVVVRQYADEGGMNLNMPADIIERLADRGGEAGRNITQGNSATGLGPFDFDMHQWIRYRSGMAAIDETLSDMHDHWANGMQEHVESHDSATKTKYPAGAGDLEATHLVLALAESLAELGHPASLGNVPRPQATVRLTPPL